MQLQMVVPDVITFSSLISALEKGEQPEQALEAFHAMQQQGVVPNVVPYNALLLALEKDKQPEPVKENPWASKSAVDDNQLINEDELMKDSEQKVEVKKFCGDKDIMQGAKPCAN